jgi:ubiquitin-small subunit ribosomal protein S27Ae
MAAPAKPAAKAAAKPVAKAVQSARYKLYEKKGNSASRKNSFCPKCGPGIFMASHKDRRTCGKCGYMEKK